MLTRVRRIAVVTVVLIVVVLGLGAIPASAAAESATPVFSQQSDGETGGGAPSIIPDPDDRGTNNIGGLLVGTVLLGGWLAVGTVIFVRARRRRSRVEALPGG